MTRCIILLAVLWIFIMVWVVATSDFTAVMTFLKEPITNLKVSDLLLILLIFSIIFK